MILTTGYDIQGYFIKEYVDVIFDEMLVGVGLLKGLASSIDNSISAITGGEATAITEKLRTVKAALRKRVISEATRIGANALIGIDFENSTLGSMIMVSMTATAVKAVKIIDPLPYTEETGVPTASKINVLKLNQIIDEQYLEMYSKKNKHFADRYTEFLNEISEIEAEVSETDKRYAEHKAKSDAIKAEISIKKDEISKNISTINKLEQYGKGTMALQQVEEKKRENQQIEHAICGLLSEIENISKDLSVAREKANDANKRLKEKRVQLDRYCKANGINN